MLERLLKSLKNQVTEELFTYSLVIVDNDSGKSAKGIVDTFKTTTSLVVEYYDEPEQNIALARNRAVTNAVGNYVAFIDDDEFAENQWLVTLFKALQKHNVSGVLGPVKPHFESDPPEWIKKGRYFEKALPETGTVLPWENTRTSNALVVNVFQNSKENLFNPGFGSGGEDRDFFRRMMQKGQVFISCDDAPVYEDIPAERCNKAFILKRALLRGKVSLVDSSSRYTNIMKSIIAVPVYLIVLPLGRILGEHVYMKYLIKIVEHVGRLLTALGVNVVKEKYIMCTDVKQ
jgi:succinoglycan biosynthesis protein ExoM